MTETGEQLPKKLPVNQGPAVGIDIGLNNFAVLSSGTTIANPRHLRSSLERLKVLQRRASRRKRGSANRKKAVRRVATLHEKIANGCEYIHRGLSLKDREWRCPHCGELVDRDHNAAKNILEFALSRHSGMGRPAEPVESPAVAGAVKQEKFRRALPVS